MMIRILSVLCFSVTLFCAACGQVAMPEPYGPVPSRQQLEWQKMEYYMFVHFGPNTFSGVEWGDGSENPDIFNPS
ncbi:MAG TPA: glycoside hydrolase family 29 (alpha-L-fucosidase), partial [Bacteroidales bacterium]|nr:glycoside hydrolase family 29 (alpha-L-fucosidase) [Bacteroidales bacterium]